MMDKLPLRNCELRAKRLLKKRKRTLDFYLYDLEYNMGSAASTKSKDSDIRDDSDSQLEPEQSEIIIKDENTELDLRCESTSPLHLRRSNVSLEEVDVSVDDCRNELGKKQKTNHVYNGVGLLQETHITRARHTSKRLGTPFVGHGMPVEPPIRHESFTNTKGVNLLQIHEQSPCQMKRNGTGEVSDDRSESRLARSMKMNNTDILRSGRNDVFDNKPFSNIRDLDRETLTLHHVSQRKPGTSAILNQLGKQGIVSADAATERSIGELRQTRMLSNQDDMPYIPSMDAPRRHAPRLAPITHNNSSLRDAMCKPPWERNVLSNDKSSSRNSPFDFNPPLFTASGKSWGDDVMPLEIRHNTGRRLKVSMMDDSDKG